MKKYIASLFYSLVSLASFSQVTIDTTIKLDLLKSPASPAFNILGIALSDVERPTDLNSFALSVQNATNNFTTIPQSYGFQIAPFLLAKKKYSLNEFDDNKNTFKQSFLISTGFTHIGPKGKENIDSLKTTKLGIGIKFSIVRPKWSEKTRISYGNLTKGQVILLEEYRSIEAKNIAVQNRKDSITKALNAFEQKSDLTDAETQQRMELIKEMQKLVKDAGDENNGTLKSSPTFERLKKIASSFKTERKGFFLDFSSGFALDFPENRFNNSNVYRAGIWLTGGHENGNSGFTSLFIARYLYNPKSIFADPTGLIKDTRISTFDVGGKILLDVSKEKFVLGAEGIYRSILGSSIVDPSWRLVLNAEYDLGINKKITFAFGRDFDGSTSKGGNLIAALNLITGLGSDRKIANKN